MIPSKEVYIIDDVFDSSTADQLYESCQRHFEFNVLASDFIEITNSIVDCHGLALSKSKYFPYSENCWNILCLKIKKHVVEYCEELGYDESYVVPFSCWAERTTQQDTSNLNLLDSLGISGNLDSEGLQSSVYDAPEIAIDDQVNKHMIRSVYNLISPDPFFGSVIYFDYKDIKRVYAKPNRLAIYDGGSYRSHHLYPEPKADNRQKYNIIFDWYINDPFGVPDWVLP